MWGWVQEWWVQGADDAVEEGCVVEEAGVWVGDCKDRIEDCGEVEGVDGGGGGGDDDAAGLGEAR